MKLKRLTAAVLALCLLTGCASLLEREYVTAEPHSSKFWESEAAGTLRAENLQDIVNDLLLLIGEHRETATLRLYHFKGDLTVADMVERATVEVQQETPFGAYAVEYITSTGKEQRGYYEVQLQIGYRRTAEQLQSIVNATAPEALYSLLEHTLASGGNELVVKIGYWAEDGQARVERTIQQLRVDQGLEGSPGWTVNYYPEQGPVGLIEVLLDVPPPEVQEAEKPQESLDENPDGEGENLTDPESEEPVEKAEGAEAPSAPEEKTEKILENSEQKP